MMIPPCCIGYKNTHVGVRLTSIFYLSESNLTMISGHGTSAADTACGSQLLNCVVGGFFLDSLGVLLRQGEIN